MPYWRPSPSAGGSEDPRVTIAGSLGLLAIAAGSAWFAVWVVRAQRAVASAPSGSSGEDPSGVLGFLSGVSMLTSLIGLVCLWYGALWLLAGMSAWLQGRRVTDEDGPDPPPIGVREIDADEALEIIERYNRSSRR